MFSPHSVARWTAMSLLVAVLAGTPAVFAQAPKEPADVNKLLMDARTESAQLKTDAVDMKTYTMTRLSWQTHAAQIDRIKGHANEVGMLVFKLNNARGVAAPWQQEAIDRINPLLNELVGSLNGTIDHFSQVSFELQMSPYRDYVAANATLASNLAKLISDFVDYGESKAKANDFERQLNIPVS